VPRKWTKDASWLLRCELAHLRLALNLLSIQILGTCESDGCLHCVRGAALILIIHLPTMRWKLVRLIGTFNALTHHSELGVTRGQDGVDC